MSLTGHYIKLAPAQVSQIAKNNTIPFEYDPGAYDLDIGTSWRTLHYILSTHYPGSPLEYAVPVVKEQGVDYGDTDAYWLSPEDVAAAVEAMYEVDEEDLREVFDFDDLVESGIFPALQNDDDEEYFIYIASNYTTILEFYEEALEENMGILFYLAENADDPLMDLPYT